VLRWLTRLFRQREAAETASLASPPPPASPAAVNTLTASSPTATLDRPTEASGPGANAEPEKETCPTCGRTSVFAGPPGQRFCTYCALRDELFEARAAASE